MHLRNIARDFEYRRKFAGYYRMRFVSQQYRDSFFALFEAIKNDAELSFVDVARNLSQVDGRHMICQRPAHKARGLLWEFVGGKVEPRETKEQALIRECREELAVTLDVGEVFMDVVHQYPDLTVHLTLFHATIREGTPQKLEHNDIRWITVDEIDQFAFCPADEVILTKLRSLK